MNDAAGAHGRWVIIATVLVSMVLTIMPLPESLQLFRPQWTALVLFYWCMALPERIGVGSGFVSGLFLDILTGTLLGQHAFGLSIIAFLATKSHQRIRVFPIWQQALFIISPLFLERLIFVWINGSIDIPNQHYYLWLPPLLGGLLWPWIFIVLRDLRRSFHVR